MADSPMTTLSPTVPTCVVTDCVRYPMRSNCNVTSVPESPASSKRPSAFVTVDSPSPAVTKTSASPASERPDTTVPVTVPVWAWPATGTVNTRSSPASASLTMGSSFRM